MKRRIQLKKRTDYHRIYAIGDIHIGAAECDYEEFTRCIREIEEDDNCAVIVMGDVIDAVGTSDPRFEMECLDPRFQGPKALRNLPKAQCDYAIKHFRRIKDKIVAWLTGNHEDAVKRHSAKAGYEFSPTDYMLEQLEIEEVGMDYEGYLSLEFRADNAPKKGADVLTLYVHHGNGGGILPGGKMNKMDKALNAVEADAFLMGHTHELLAGRKGRLRWEDGVLSVHDMLMVNTGTFLKTYSSDTEKKKSGYGARALYAPVSIGMARLIAWPKKGILQAVI
jgi:UDP-2,3-diacylglucosamine pyrophosphatase LpxH